MTARCPPRLVLLLPFLVTAPYSSLAQFDGVEDRPRIQVTDDTINAGDVVHWTAGNVYVLNGAVFVEDGAELHIEAGTVVKAAEGQNVDASALVVARGGKIFAEGTAEQPIIFTSDQDNISGFDLLTYEDRGLWGGIVILGRAVTNNPGDTSGEFEEIEGVNEVVDEGDTRAQYGGTNDEDNSGIMRYVSIRHTGINIGESDGNEIQGLTLGGVGSRTTLEYIESYASGDDGVEFFGGTVNLKYFVSAFNADDAIDWDQGWRGKGQFWFVLQGRDNAGAAAEQDGAGLDEYYKPYAIPTIYNATYVGAGVGNTPEGDRAEMLMFRDNSGGFYHNSIFTDFHTSEGGFALTIEDVDNSGSMTEDSRQRFENGELALTHNLWWAFGAGQELSSWVNSSDAAAKLQIMRSLADNGNVAADPMLRGIERGTEGTGTLDPRPADGSPAFSSPLAEYNDPYFTPTNFMGAFGRDNWAVGWTALDALGYLDDVVTSIETIDINEVPSSTSLGENYPNPFNAGTTIEFAVERAAQIRLAVYDLVGRQIALLYDGEASAGLHRIAFDASGLSSGLYIYRLDTETSSISRKMIVVE